MNPGEQLDHATSCIFPPGEVLTLHQSQQVAKAAREEYATVEPDRLVFFWALLPSNEFVFLSGAYVVSDGTLQSAHQFAGTGSPTELELAGAKVCVSRPKLRVSTYAGMKLLKDVDAKLTQNPAP